MLSGVKYLLLRRHLMLCECRRARHNFERRAGRIFARNRLVVHWVIGVVVQDIPILRRDAAREEIWIERGSTDHREHFARLRIHNHCRRRVCVHRSKLRIHRLLCRFLNILVDCQDEIMPRHR